MKVLVLGGGVIGLSCTLRIRELFDCEIVVYSDKNPNETTSNGAGGLWMPSYCENENLVNKWCTETFKYLEKRHKDLDPLIEKMEHRHYLPEPMSKKYWPPWADKSIERELNIRTGETKDLKENLDDSLQEERPYYWSFNCFVTDTVSELRRMVKVLEKDAKVDLQFSMPTLKSVVEIEELAKSLNCEIVINCTGLGSQTLLKDNKMMPGKGVLLMYERPKDANVSAGIEEGWISSFEEACYVIHRGSVTVVGGSLYENDYSPGIKTDDVLRLKRNASLLCPQLKGKEPIGSWAGYRPLRKTGIRLDLMKLSNGTPMINNYGHGGSGWTLFHGAANAVADLIRSDILNI